ncbi:hypothetical protein EDC94DRAFT_593959 [Helicostylum pulchrum]|nr:hypothetical protein EDC94DRAFT_593959 [Helicostylum pulchrum]
MDFIELERIEPFKQQPSPTPKFNLFDKRKPTAFNKKRPAAVAPSSSIMNSMAYENQYGQVNGLFQKLRTKTCEPQPIPPQVIPLMAFTEQVEEYENKFLNESRLVDGLTIQALMQPYSDLNASAGRNARYGKFLFLTRLFQRIINQNMNYDAAVICCDRHSEQLVYSGLDSAGLNVRTMSSMFNKKTYGVMVKIRKDTKNRRDYRPVTRNIADAVFVYDSACGVNLETEWSILKGVRFDHPSLFYLACMDTAEVRIHTYNRSLHNSKIPLRWNTKVCDLDHDLQQLLLLQPNRLPEYVVAIAWNDHLSQTLFNWILDKTNILYEFRFPTKGGLLDKVNTFLPHHPSCASTLPVVYTDVKAILAALPPPPPPTRDPQPAAKALPRPDAWAARPAEKAAQPSAKDVRPRVHNESSNIRADNIVVPVGKSTIPTVKVSSLKTPLLAAKLTAPVVKTPTTNPAGNTLSRRPPGVETSGCVLSTKPPVASAGIHPERMAMIGGNIPLPSSLGMDTIERKRGRDLEEVNIDVQKRGKMPTMMKDTQDSNATADTVMEEIGDSLKNTETTVAVPNDATPTSSNPSDSTSSNPRSFASEFEKTFSESFKNALQKFEDELLNIKF